MRAFRDAIGPSAAALVAKYTVRLNREYPFGTFAHAGSAVLIQIDEARFLVTAAHALRLVTWSPTGLRLSPNNSHIWISVPGRDVSLVNLDGHVTSDAVEGEKDARDFAVLRLTPSTVDALGDRVAYLRCSSMDLSDVVRFRATALDLNDSASRDGWHVTQGFPSVDVSHKVRPDDGARVGLVYPSSNFGRLYDLFGEPPIEDFDRRVHVAMSWDITSAQNVPGSPKASREELEPADPRGISGGGIWRVTDGFPTDASEWTEDDVKLVGIEHRLGQGHTTLCGTKISCILHSIYVQYEELRPVLDLYAPADNWLVVPKPV